MGAKGTLDTCRHQPLERTKRKGTKKGQTPSQNQWWPSTLSELRGAKAPPWPINWKLLSFHRRWDPSQVSAHDQTKTDQIWKSSRKRPRMTLPEERGPRSFGLRIIPTQTKTNGALRTIHPLETDYSNTTGPLPTDNNKVATGSAVIIRSKINDSQIGQAILGNSQLTTIACKLANTSKWKSLMGINGTTHYQQMHVSYKKEDHCHHMGVRK